MDKARIEVASITPSSTENAWAQTYHAGGVSALVCVRQKPDSKDSQTLSVVGKDLLNTFESEYFTLPTKNLAAIKEAVQITYDKSKENYAISLIVASVMQNAVYIVLAGTGKILLIRNNTLATLLEQEASDVLSASGFLENDDAMVLATPEFSEKVSSASLLETIAANPLHVAAEIIAPEIHKEKNGAAAALFVSYHEAPTQEKQTKEAPLEQKEKLHEAAALPTEEKSEIEKTEPTDMAHEIPLPQQKKRRLTHRQRLFLTIAIVLVVVLVGTIYLSLKNRQANQTSALFSQVYPPALSKYQEAQGLQDLNTSLAQSDYNQAKQLLENAKSKFPANSSEEQQIVALLAKVNAAISPSASSPQTPVTKVATGTDALLDFAAKQNAKYVAQDSSTFYFANSSGIRAVAKSGGNAKQVVQNGGDWKNLGGFATYLGNMYVLDTTDGIDKYPGTQSGFGSKATYFSGSTPDLSKAVSIAIDGSIWILTGDGNILEYNKGTAQTFTVSGLSPALASPTQIVTGVDDNNVYMLDNGNSRIVVLKKNGTFVAAYTNSLIQKATQLDVDETNKKAYFLSGGSVYEIDMK